MLPISEKAKIQAAKASGKRNALRASLEVFRISGEYLTMTEIAKRLGISKETVKDRMHNLRKASGAITLERLGVGSE